MTNDQSIPTILYEARGGVAWVTLNRPSVLNALNLQMRDEIWSALDAAALDPEVGVVVFRGAGERAFSSGADLTEFGTAPTVDAARRSRVERDLWGRLLAFEKPLIAAVHGYALGAGCELSLLCDLRIAADDALFGLPEVRLAYLPSAGGSQTLPRLIGPGRALDMILSGEPVGAQVALECGLVHAVVAHGDLDDEASRWAQRLVRQPREALRLAKQALVAGIELSLADGLRLEARLRSRSATSPT